MHPLAVFFLDFEHARTAQICPKTVDLRFFTIDQWPYTVSAYGNKTDLRFNKITIYFQRKNEARYELNTNNLLLCDWQQVFMHRGHSAMNKLQILDFGLWEMKNGKFGKFLLFKSFFSTGWNFWRDLQKSTMNFIILIKHFAICRTPRSEEVKN